MSSFAIKTKENPENIFLDILKIPQLKLKRKVQGKQQHQNHIDIIYGS